MEKIKEIFQDIKDFLSVELFTIGGKTITLWSILISILLIILLVIVASLSARILKNKILKRYKMDLGLRDALGSLFKYLFIILGLVVIFSSVGIDLSAFTVLLGTLGVGIGFGLQNITSNFISGISLLLERPIKVGDRIEVGETSGEIVKIGLRATTVLTNDNIAIIVPNSDFMTKEVVNWSYNDKKVRLRIKIGVGYSSDVRLIEKILLEVAEKNGDVLKDPAPAARFMGFGDSALDFELQIWTTELIHRPGKLTSDLYFSIFEALNKHNIEIPFPQRVVHIEKNERQKESRSDSD